MRIAGTEGAASVKSDAFSQTATQRVGDQRRSRLHVFRRCDGPAREHLGLGDVGGDHRGPGKQLAHQRVHGGVGDERRARRGHHNGIDHDIGGFVAIESIGDGAHDGRRRHHADLHRIGPDVVEDGVDLGAHENGIHLEHVGNAERVLGRERRDDALAEQLWAMMVFKSAWMPAPPLESDPAMVRTAFMAFLSRKYRMRLS